MKSYSSPNLSCLKLPLPV
ncbi:hypothetical protein LSH36_43g00026 [Paralvinella palmiformis]|uniref:Uncharacterized protein n=1 Tax=Paralvinella palmiformis TaxID=53620 RepID=A0AAD9K786_9ANNE|nr:hypothetical protein LSH36_43g00026 [Paralvinella palmiformis]